MAHNKGISLGPGQERDDAGRFLRIYDTRIDEFVDSCVGNNLALLKQHCSEL